MECAAGLDDRNDDDCGPLVAVWTLPIDDSWSKVRLFASNQSARSPQPPSNKIIKWMTQFEKSTAGTVNIIPPKP